MMRGRSLDEKNAAAFKIAVFAIISLYGATHAMGFGYSLLAQFCLGAGITYLVAFVVLVVSILREH